MIYFIDFDRICVKTTLFCGQSFRHEQHCDTFVVFSGDKSVTVTQTKPSQLMLTDTTAELLPYWRNYFNADCNYTELIADFSLDPTLKAACEFSPGLRVLKQEPYETLISFIISQNNNIKRISGSIAKLIELYGVAALTDPAVLADAPDADLCSCGLGYRAEYVKNAAKKVKFNEIDLDELEKIGYNRAKEQLLTLKGVGEKVADCVLLFGLNKTEAFPKDVWIKRALNEFYPCGLPECVGNNAGIAQQFLFHYMRNKDNLRK